MRKLNAMLTPLILNGKVLFGFTTSDGTNYLSPDGAFTGILINGDFIVTDSVTGDQVTLNKDFQSGDFGITLFADTPAPAPVTPDYTITGGVLVLGGGNNAIAVSDGSSNWSNIQVGDGNNTINGGSTSASMIGVAGSYSGSDIIQAGNGNNVISGNGGNGGVNTLFFQLGDILYRVAANEECVAHHRQCERKVA